MLPRWRMGTSRSKALQKAFKKPSKSQENESLGRLMGSDSSIVAAKGDLMASTSSLLGRPVTSPLKFVEIFLILRPP